MKLTPTPEQAAIIAAATSTQTNIMISAYAGTAKTSTLEMLAAQLPPQPALALAFNVKIKKEMEQRLPAWFTVKTMNGLGHQAWSKAINGRPLRLEERKLGKLTTKVLQENGFAASGEQWVEVKDWAGAARQAGLIPKDKDSLAASLIEDTPEAWADLSQQAMPDMALAELAREVLRQSIDLAREGEVDFDDQIYCSALLGGVFPQFPLVLVDEAQDLSPLNHIQVAKSAAKRLIVVGDRKQAIYAFRGADSRSMDKLKALRLEWIDLPLSLTFRCPKIIVRRSQSHAPGFRAAEANAEGTQHNWLPQAAADEKGPRITHLDQTTDSWSWQWLASLKKTPAASLAIVCRNNAPLLGMAFKLIRQGIGPQMLGRDIGKGLIALSRKIAPKDQIPRDKIWLLLDDWQREEEAKAKEAGKEHLIAGIVDRAECLRAVLEADGVGDAGAMRQALERLFAKEYGQVVLGTGHKVKGLEYDVVLHLDPFRLPSKWAKKAAQDGDYAQLEQERNLLYVIETRTRDVLVEANLEDFQ